MSNNLYRLAFVVSVLLLAGLANAAGPLTPERLARIDALVTAEIEKGNFPGAVVSIGRREGVLLTKAYGQKQLKPAPAPMQVDTIFDIASLSKPVATAPSVLLLIEAGRIGLDDPVMKYLPAFAAQGKEGILIRHLLAHVSGLPAYMTAATIEKAHGPVCPDAVIEAICAIKPLNPPDEAFRYSCLNYITLGKIVELVSGQSLDAFAREHLFVPLGMTDTTYNPPADWKSRIAGTQMQGDRHPLGQVHDPLAGLMGGISGNAGVFATADDLGKMCRMLLNGGRVGERQMLSTDSIKRLTTPQALGRAYGYDVSSSYAWIKGKTLSPASFCHSGYTGTSLVCDPVKNLYLIILTNRVHPADQGSVRTLRLELANLVGEE